MKQIHVEASTFCNARCPLCPRSLYGYKVDGVHKELHLDPKVFETEFVDTPDKNIVDRLVNTRKWSVESDEKWITTEKEPGSYDYDIEETK